MAENQNPNRNNPIIILGVLLVVIACIFFGFVEENVFNWAAFLAIGLFLLGIFILCLPSMLEKKRKANRENNPESNDLVPPRRIQVDHTEIEDDSDRYSQEDVYQKPEEYRKQQEQYHHDDPVREEKKKDEHVVCPYCGFINSPGRKECLLCHKQMNETCPKCGKSNPAGSQICHHCGAPMKEKAKD